MPVPGLDELEADWGTPPVWLTFQSYHLMIAIGMLFIATTLYASYLRWRGTLFTTRWLLWYFVFAVVLAFVANEAGWVTAEVGRQPWIVYPTMTDGVLGGGLRTSDAVSEAITREHVLGFDHHVRRRLSAALRPVDHPAQQQDSARARTCKSDIANDAGSD